MIEPGRGADFENPELRAGMDFRLPEHRRETFHRFYEFHLRHQAHPGGVYYVMRSLREQLGWDPEEALWFAFINGNTQNPVTSLIIHRRFPRPAVALEMCQWFSENRTRLAYDTDRRHHRTHFADSVEGYIGQVGWEQEDYWRHQAHLGFPYCWEAANRIPTFGRLSAFSYLEYLAIMGMPIECTTLFLGDKDGSRSHRNGLAIVTGRDDLDWHASNPNFTGHYPPRVMEWLKDEGEALLTEARRRAAGQAYEGDVGYFTLESALCTYKSWHRPNRRYPGVYNDLLYARLRTAEAAWPGEDFGPLWQARAEALPEYLRLECVPKDPGAVPLKQNWYREHGCPPMMHKDDPAFANELNDAIDAGELPERKEQGRWSDS